MKETPTLTKDVARDLLHILLQGWADQSNTDGVDLDELFRRYADGDANIASMLALMSHWSNDLMSHAADFGLTLEMKDEIWIVVEVPPKPPGNFYWSCGSLEWNAKRKAYWYRAGKWKRIPREVTDAAPS